ncbi:class F sortase, partial [Candidatus Roizmanbacteria bacterium]|nr:class F sortase [Candidatus Roizmanbacteria bacterium]
EAGDIVQAQDETGRLYTYEVVNIQIYPFDQVPLGRVFGKSPHAQLNLITCTGWFNQTTHNYSHRLVVYTELKY